jgi:hypothetical protein
VGQYTSPAQHQVAVRIHAVLHNDRNFPAAHFEVVIVGQPGVFGYLPKDAAVAGQLPAEGIGCDDGNGCSRNGRFFPFTGRDQEGDAGQEQARTEDK